MAFAELQSCPEILGAIACGNLLERVNFNRGVSGRGASELDGSQLSRIDALIHRATGLRGTRLGRYLVGGYPALGCSPADVLDHKTRQGVAPEWFLEDQPIAGSKPADNSVEYVAELQEQALKPSCLMPYI
jgi:hypothetical protein